MPGVLGNLVGVVLRPGRSPLANSRAASNADVPGPAVGNGAARSSARTWAAMPPPSARRRPSSCSAPPTAPGATNTFWQFTRYGLVVTVISIALAVPYLWLRFFAF
ncbi:MAG TPA: hypothetical protein VFO68_28105 [Actinophytocola sp.]|nr:hypothetical protein [Actinophytocola sp.]